MDFCMKNIRPYSDIRPRPSISMCDEMLKDQVLYCKLYGTQSSHHPLCQTSTLLGVQGATCIRVISCWTSLVITPRSPPLQIFGNGGAWYKGESPETLARLRIMGEHTKVLHEERLNETRTTYMAARKIRNKAS